MKLSITLLVLGLATFARSLDNSDLDIVVDNSDYEVDMRITTLNDIFEGMIEGESKEVHKANDSKLVLIKESDLKLIAEFMVYDPSTEKHQLAVESTYYWNDKVGSLIAKKCKDHPVDIRPPSVSSECESSIFRASRIIGLELTGVIDIEGYQSENLEKCIAAKLPPKIVNSNYMTCFINIVGDDKYIGEALKEKIAEMRAKGYHCEEDGRCIRSEDPDIFAQILERKTGENTPVKVEGDSRPRYCDVITHPIMIKSEGTLGTFMQSYVYPCKNWVKAIHCKTEGDRLYFSIEYTDKEGHVETFRPHPFDEGHGTRTRVRYESGERIHFLRFFTSPGQLILKELELEFSTGRKKVCKLPKAYRIPRNKLNNIEVGLSGEWAGMEYQMMAGGIRIAGINEML